MKRNEVSLGDTTNIMTGFPFKSAEYVEDSDGIPLVRGDNVVQGTFRWDGVKRWPATRLDDFRDFMLQEKDIVLAMDRPWIEVGLKYSAIRANELPALLVQRTARLRAKPGLDQTYLKYVIGSKDFTDYVLSVQTGTAVPHISAQQIKQFRFNLPPIPEQRRIAHILGTLDDKIELNRRMNETLEALARVIFKSWFVDFDPVRAKAEGRTPFGIDSKIAALFPDSFEDSDIDAVPKGWKVSQLSEFVQIVRESVNPKLSPDESFDLYSIPAFDEGKFPQVVSGSAIMSNKFVVPSDAILLSKLNPRIPRVWHVKTREGRRSLCSTEYIVVTPSKGTSREFIFNLITEETFTTSFASLVTGTSGSHQRVKPENLLGLRIVAPPSDLAKRFGELVHPMLTRVQENVDESRTLTVLRDTLQPRLLNGDKRNGFGGTL